MAGPLREGGGAGTLFCDIFLFCCYLKIRIILLKTTYQNINTANDGKVVVFYHVCCNIWRKKSKIVQRKKVFRIRLWLFLEVEKKKF